MGAPGPEVDGRLYLDTALGNLQNSEVTGNPLLVQRNRLRTNTNDDPNSGLKMNHDIAVFGTFDFIVLENPLDRYSIRLTDFQTDYTAGVPEPASLALMLAGLVGVGFARRRAS